jgi:serine/threonine-protein kinase RsbW
MKETSTDSLIRIEIPSRLELLGVVDKLADGITEFMGFEDLDRDAVAISVIEACTNAIQHGHHADGMRMVRVSFEMQKDSLIVVVEDEGHGFDPSLASELPPPDLLATRGRGIYIMRTMMDEVKFDFTAGTCVRLVKHRSQPLGDDGEAG